MLQKTLPIQAVTDEFRIWTQLIRPEIEASGNVTSICEYGTTEILNNVIDHAKANFVSISCGLENGVVRLSIQDDGVGVFDRLRGFYHFDSNTQALIELIKGKLTIAPEAHSGEGLFFASKMFDRFSIVSGGLRVVFSGDSCLVEAAGETSGTAISMEIAKSSTRTAKEVFDRFCGGENFAFYKTRFLMSAAAFEGNLISRSQAKRVAARLEEFSEVEISFAGVGDIGQAFADELFRVWPSKHPATRLIATNTGDAVVRMIGHVQSRADLPQATGHLGERTAGAPEP